MDHFHVCRCASFVCEVKYMNVVSGGLLFDLTAGPLRPNRTARLSADAPESSLGLKVLRAWLFRRREEPQSKVREHRAHPEDAGDRVGMGWVCYGIHGFDRPRGPTTVGIGDQFH